LIVVQKQFAKYARLLPTTVSCILGGNLDHQFTIIHILYNIMHSIN